MSAQQPQDPKPPAEPSIAEFTPDPPRDLGRWAWLWRGDHRFPIRSDRGLLGRLVVAVKRLLRPLVVFPQRDLWDRQRVFNLILLEHLGRLEDLRLESRLAYLEGFRAQGVRDLMAHNDALFSRVDQKLDRHERQVRELLATLQGALALVERSPAAAPRLSRSLEERAYLELEERYRGSEEDIARRFEAYLPWLRDLPGPVLDLGCGRGETLRVLGAAGVAARGVDSSARMVERCRAQGLAAEEGDLLTALAAVEPGTLGAVVSFHVIEHLPAVDLDRLVHLAHRALAPGGALILETPSPLSLVAGARNFWLDPTHRRPVHPEALLLLCELAGFAELQALPLRPFPPAERLPELDLGTLPAELHELAHRVNRLRDRLDELLFGEQDYAVVGRRG
jgi:O-antigen chain-terminating methyltransferase